MKAKTAGKSEWVSAVVVQLLKAVAVTAMVATPLLGVWVASSLFALRRGPVWLTLLAGLLLFPILPVCWELWSTWRKARAKPGGPSILSLSDRLILRTLLLNAAFLAALLVSQPSAAFTALSARGDWMLDGRSDALADSLRPRLFAAAAKLEWLYLIAHDNPFRKPTPAPGPSSLPPPLPAPPVPSAPAAVTAVAATEAPRPTPAQPSEAAIWPVPATLHPLVEQMPSEAESSIETVAEYLKARLPAPTERLKAVHDYVADRVAYDASSYFAGKIPPQDAETVFRTHLSVCAGYANLLEAIGRAAGLDVVYVTGDGRPAGSALSGESHAWNAARFDGRWYLIDATWDSGGLSRGQFHKDYGTAYFLTPPRLFVSSHFPDEAKWQLLPKAVSRGEFLRLPALSPAFFASGLELLAPDRSQVDVQGRLDILLKNTKNVYLLANYAALAARAEGSPCDVQNGPAPRIGCKFREPGQYEVKLFMNTQPSGTFDFVGQVQVNAY